MTRLCLLRLSVANGVLWTLLAVAFVRIDDVTRLDHLVLSVVALVVWLLTFRPFKHVFDARVMHAPGQVSRDSSEPASSAQSVGHAP